MRCLTVWRRFLATAVRCGAIAFIAAGAMGGCAARDRDRAGPERNTSGESGAARIPVEPASTRVAPRVGARKPYIPVCDLGGGPFSLEIDNQYFPLTVGQVSVFDGEEDGEVLHLEITVLDETELVAGVTTRVVEERESANGAIVEVSRNFFAQAPDGTVCYFGEDVDIYEGGVVASHDGAWRAGVDGNRPGIMMPAAPAVGQTYDQEVAPGIAKDHAEIIAMGEPVTVPAGTFDDTLKTEETSPLEPGAKGYKDYARGVGLLMDGDLALTGY